MKKRFVVQEHHSSHLHFDFRLQMDKLLRSWAIPKGPSMNPIKKRLAIQVEDHPEEYLNFEGIIPNGYKGTGAVIIWDRGTYDLLDQKEDMLSFILHGEILKGNFSLIRLKKGKENEWLFMKKRDKYADINWKLQNKLTDDKKNNLKEKIPPCDDKV